MLVTKDYIPDDWESECQNASNDSLKQNLAGKTLHLLHVNIPLVAKAVTANEML